MTTSLCLRRLCLVWVVICSRSAASKLRGKQIAQQLEYSSVASSSLDDASSMNHNDRRRMESVASFWTEEEMEKAIPREVLIDPEFAGTNVNDSRRQRHLVDLFNYEDQIPLPRHMEHPNQFLVPWGTTFLEATVRHEETNTRRRLAQPVSHMVAPANGAIIRESYVDFILDVSDPDGEEDLNLIILFLDNGQSVSQTSFAPSRGADRYNVMMGPIPDGTYLWSVMVRDQSGESSVRVTHEFEVDTTTASPSDAPSSGAPTSEAPTTTEPTHSPSFAPSTEMPSADPTLSPSTSTPSSSPTTTEPSANPTFSSTEEPSQSPTTSMPTNNPSAAPTKSPSAVPSSLPSTEPTNSHSPSWSPTVSSFPSALPSSSPSLQPSLSMAPSQQPSESQAPSVSPSLQPSTSPSESLSPSHSPSASPTDVPSNSPSFAPTTAQPSLSPSSLPSLQPSVSSQPSTSPTSSEPTSSPSAVPSNGPTLKPSAEPTSEPTAEPTVSPTVSPSTETPTSMPTRNVATANDVSFSYISPNQGETVNFSASNTVDFQWEVRTTTAWFSVSQVILVLEYPDGREEYTNTIPSSSGTGSTSVTMQETGVISWSLRAVLNNAQVIQGPLSSFTVQQSTANAGPPRCEQLTRYPESNRFDDLHKAVVRILFQISGQNYLCSGTLVQGPNDRVIIATAAHCLYDKDTNTFASNVIAIPAQDDGGTDGTDRNCSNDPAGCFYPNIGVVHETYTQVPFMAGLEYDYGFFVGPDTDLGALNGPHAGTHSSITPMAINFNGIQDGVETHLYGYPAAHDPHFMYSIGKAESSPIGGSGSFVRCSTLTGGASGGPWTQADPSSGSLVVQSVNSWGYGNGNPGMGASSYSTGGAACVYQAAASASMSGGNIVATNCPT